VGVARAHATVLPHHGSIRVASKEDEGAAFVVRLPLHQ